MKRARIGAAMPHEFPFQLHAALDDAWVEQTDVGIEGDCGADVALRKHIHETKDTNAIAIVAM